MKPCSLREKIIAERTAWIRKMTEGIQSLPLDSVESFASDPRNIASAESYLRRALETLMDLGRHILAKGFGKVVVEYKEISQELHRADVLEATDARLMRELAGYRNRMVHSCWIEHSKAIPSLKPNNLPAALSPVENPTNHCIKVTAKRNISCNKVIPIPERSDKIELQGVFIYNSGWIMVNTAIGSE